MYKYVHNQVLYIRTNEIQNYVTHWHHQAITWTNVDLISVEVQWQSPDCNFIRDTSAINY